MIENLVFGAALLGACAWASNIWPGIETWGRTAASRFMWWAAPFSLIALHQGVSWDHALYLGAGAWLGSWMPHTDMPDIRTHWTGLLSDVAVAVLRAIALLAVPAAVFWACGAFWFAMILAAGSVIPAILAGSQLPHRWIGLRSERQVAGVLFGAMVGVFVSAAIGIDVPTPDYLP